MFYWQPYLGNLFWHVCGTFWAELEREALEKSQEMVGASLQGGCSESALLLGKGGRAAVVDSPGNCKPS